MGHGELPEDEKRRWLRVWSVYVPNKVKIFLWRLKSGFLPVLFELKRRHVVIDDKCPRCGSGSETLAHALRGCMVARAIWNCANFSWDHGYGVGELEAWRFLHDAQDLNGKELQQFSILAWTIWTGRNQEVHGEIRKKPMQAARFALDYIVEYNDAQVVVSMSSLQRSIRWRPPARDLVKVNFDGALQVTERRGGIGIIIRNNLGEVMGTAAAPVDRVVDPLIVEALAAVKAIQFSVDMGFRNVEIEGDCKSVMGRLSSQNCDMSAVGMILEEGKILMHCFTTCSFSHTFRDGNKAAHALAQLGCNLASEVVWVEDYHGSIQSFIASDVLSNLHD
ncbi:hypothetical protein PTKIN_Ptkin08bG0091900 [Pterospermum kingtungense]